MPASRRYWKRLAAPVIGASLVAAVLPTPWISRAAAAGAADIRTVAGNGSPYFSGDGGPAVNAGIPVPAGVVLTGSGMDVSEQDGRVRRVTADGNIHPLAGGGTLQPSPDGAIATRAVIDPPSWVVTDGNGNLYFSTGARVRKVDAATGRLVTVAGTGVPGYSGDGGAATQAQLNSPNGIALDAEGDLFIADRGNYRIREVSASTGAITTIAGTGVAGSTGDGGPATAATMTPSALAVDPSGDVFFADLSGARVRRIDAATRIATTVAGGGPGTPDGGPALSAAFTCVEGVALNATGTTMFIPDGCTNKVYRVSGGIITTVAGRGGYSAVPNDGDGGPATAASLVLPFDAVPDSSGNLYISELDHCRIRRVDSATGVITTVAGIVDPNASPCGLSGDGRPALAARLGYPEGLAFDPSGDIIFSEQTGARIRMIDPAGIISTVAGGSAGDGIPATSAQLTTPRGLGLDEHGNLLIADCGDGQVRRVDSAGVITVFAGEGSGRNGIGDGGAATDAVLDCPSGLATVASGSAAGSVYIADCVANLVRRVDPSGRVTSVAGTGTAGFGGDHGAAVQASLNCPTAVAVDGAGNLFIADQNNNRVRMVNPKGVITTVAGDGIFGIGDDGVRAIASHLAIPAGVVVDSVGNLLISDGGRVRRVSAAAPGVITTVAGSGIPGFSGDGGPAANSQLAGPSQLLVAPSGDITVADTGNSAIRTITTGAPPPPPTNGCGELVTQSITLTADLGPCPGDGIDVGANGIVINVNGHTITGTGVPGGNRAGIRLPGRHHVIVTGYQGSKGIAGQITGFEDGVAVIGGSDNVIQRLSIHDNFGGQAEFGDGIGMFASAGNQVTGNTLNNDGPYDGIGTLGQGSDGNVVQANSIANTHTSSFGGCDGTGVGVILTSFLDISWPRNVTISNNQVLSNTITGNDTAGISDIGNVGELLQGNTVTGNGVAVPCPGNGIGIQNTALNHRGSHATIQDNQVHGNGNNGIEVDTDYNHILNNNAADNNAAGGGNDLVDFSGGRYCNHNVWSGNVWGSGGYFPDCTAAGGSGPNPPPASATAPAAAQAGASPHNVTLRRRGSH